MPRPRGRPRSQKLEQLIELVAQRWSLEDPWEPGIELDFQNYGQKTAERFQRVRFPGYTYLDQLVVLAQEALDHLAKIA
jgi:hypothetical protein